MSLDSNSYLISNIKLNLGILKNRFRLNDYDFNTLYENCFRIYDKIIPNVPSKENHGKTLMLIVSDISNMLVDDFKTFEQDAINKGFQKEYLKYHLALLEDKDIIDCTKYIFGKYYGKNNP